MNNSPDVSVFCGVPNNGHFTLVFTDDGMIESANCRRKDVYEGLIRSVADMLVEFASNISPMPSDLESPGAKKQMESYVKTLQDANLMFAAQVAKRISVITTARRLENSGIPNRLSEIIATGIINEVRDQRYSDKKEEDEED